MNKKDYYKENKDILSNNTKSVYKNINSFFFFFFFIF